MELEVSRGQLGFIPGRGITGSILTLGQMAGKHREKQKEYLEKAHDRVLRHELRRRLRKREVPGRFCKIGKGTVELVCRVALTGVGAGRREDHPPTFFNTVFGVLTEDVRDGTPWDTTYANNEVRKSACCKNGYHH